MHFGKSLLRPGLSRKTIAALISASVTLTPLSPAFAAFGGGTPTIPNADAFTNDVTAPKVDSQLGTLSQYLRNGKVSVTTAGDDRAAGGTVSPTDGIGFHGTTFGLTPQQAANLGWQEFPNPYGK